MIEESFSLALRQDEWKYILPASPRWPKGRPPIVESLYNLGEDPSEKAQFN